MQTTSTTWKALWSSGSALLEVKAVIGGTDRSAEVCAAPVINRATMQNGLSVGNVVSATCMLTLRTTAAIARSASAVLSMRLTDGTTTSEWLPAGTFYISRRAKDPVTGLLTLECYDALLKANAVWTPSAGAWPRSMAAVVSELAALLGVSVDSRTALITGSDYVIDEPADGAAVRDVLAHIAACNGGNWIITPEGKLRLVPLTSAADAGDAVSDALDVVAVLNRGTVGDAAAVTGVRSTVDGVVTLTGDDTGIVVDVGIAPVIAADLAQALIGMTHQPFRLPSAVYDPAVELGDFVRYNGTVAGVLCAEAVTLAAGPRGELFAPDPAELADEYPYIGGSEKALTLAKAYAREAVEALDDDLTQQEIFDRLTDNGAAQGMVLLNGQLYINATYINTGYLSANRIQGGTLVLGGQNNVNGTMQVLDASGNVVATVNNEGVDITEGSVVAYSSDRLTRAILSDGQVALQFYGQDGSGQYTWRNMLSLALNNVNSFITSSFGGLNLSGKDSISFRNRYGMTDPDGWATFDMENDSIVLHTESRDNYTYDGDSTVDIEPNSITLSVGNTDDPVHGDDSSLALSENSLTVNIPTQNYDVSSGANYTGELRYTGNTFRVKGAASLLSGDLVIGTLSYDGHTLSVDGALSVSDPATARTNLGITPANIGAVNKAGDTMTGDLIQTSGMIKGEDNATNHAIKLGHNGDDALNFYEYGGLFNFYKSQSGTNTLLAKIDNGALWVGDPATTRANLGALPTAAINGTNIDDILSNFIGTAWNVTGTGVSSFGSTCGTLICTSIDPFGTSGTRVRQIYINFFGPDIWMRTREGTTWNAWKCLVGRNGAVPVASGGTGATDAATARTNLGFRMLALTNVTFTANSNGSYYDYDFGKSVQVLAASIDGNRTNRITSFGAVSGLSKWTFQLDKSITTAVSGLTLRLAYVEI